MQEQLEQITIEEGKEIFKKIRAEKNSFFDKQYWMGRIMDWVMKDPSFKVDLFRFVDVLPVLNHKDQVAKHVEEYLLRENRELPMVMQAALKASGWSLARGMAAIAIKKNVTEMAEKFILGLDLAGASRPLKKLEQDGFCFTIDLLGEKTLSEKEADDYFSRYEKLIHELPKTLKATGDNPPNLSIKVSALTSFLKEEDPDFCVKKAKERVWPLLELAFKNQVFINFDMETYASHEIVMKLFKEIALSQKFRSWPHLGIVLQAYLKDSPAHVETLLSLARERKSPFSIRIVKGAYWDYEFIRAQQMGISCPVFEQKWQTDENYEKLSRLLLDNVRFIKPCFASHNIRSLAQAISYAKLKGIDKNNYEIQMLFGMAEAERKVLLERGHCVRIYVPLGELLPGMSYLVRRLLENTSQMGFVKKSQHDELSEELLLKAPVFRAEPEPYKIINSFANAPSIDFTVSSEREKFKFAIDEIKAKMPFEIYPIIDGKKISNGQSIKRLSPNNKNILLSQVSFATKENADMAVKIALENAESLKALSLEKRAQHLEKLAELLSDERIKLCALICHEVGKTWAEADADVAEAIDFCRYYASCAVKNLQNQNLLGQISGEQNSWHYQPRGACLVIAPWNFPLAILCGMSVAAYVTANPVILKPAEQSSAIAQELFLLMLKAGFSHKHVQFLPGLGEEIGEHLVKSPHIATIAFTGSKEVGQKIFETASKVVFGQLQMKKVLVEMGGKNAIIIDDDADLDEAVLGVIKSAFLFSGQKCSAASRLFPISTISKTFVERLTLAAQSLVVGDSTNPSSFMGPVIDEEAYLRLIKKIENLKSDRKVKIIYAAPNVGEGYFIGPHLVEVFDKDHWLMKEELFGPIVAIYSAKNLEEALLLANDSSFALTGGFFSRSPKNIELVKKAFNVGNLYINQKCTGAMVNRQPFGGFKMSGTGIKAGGPDYLLNFVDAKVISENTMRRGFTPEST